ncbi:MAG TPA: pyrimidine dimer DNA glycosylase/endonuclease V [Blastocatellia bacterium]|nr:pyrimidine dimer DNA glycosylase/endonuclease V [Blastocatellia bacterium]
MRIWTLHPKYLDPRGLVAVWRESLLAQKVLKGETRGYRHHPQLDRFKSQENPAAAIATYLHHVCEEAERRGYKFDKGKIEARPVMLQIPSTKGQLLYEWGHLREKLRLRADEKYRELKAVKDPEAHPLFRIIEGGTEPWEIRRQS